MKMWRGRPDAETKRDQLGHERDANGVCVNCCSCDDPAHCPEGAEPCTFGD